jgi:hypothetical protein
LSGMAFLTTCCILLSTGAASAQRQIIPKQPQEHKPDSRQVKTLKTVERNLSPLGPGSSSSSSG